MAGLIFTFCIMVSIFLLDRFYYELAQKFMEIFPDVNYLVVRILHFILVVSTYIAFICVSAGILEKVGILKGVSEWNL